MRSNRLPGRALLPGSVGILIGIALLTLNGCGESTTPTAPKSKVVISDILVSVEGTRAQIQWTTNVPTQGHVAYGIGEASGMTVQDATVSTQHRVELTDLQPQTTYVFRVVGTDEMGTEGQSARLEFSTLAPENLAPQPLDLEVTAGSGNALITWRTNESATVELEYGETPAYGQSAQAGRSMQLQHRVQLSELKPDTTYYYRLKLTDADGHTFVSPEQTFKTKAQAENGENVVRVTLTARQWQFAPQTIRVSKGDRVVLTLRSADVPHGFGLNALGINQPVNPGKDEVIEFVAKKKGSHTFICTIPCGGGHANMKGTLIVE